MATVQEHFAHVTKHGLSRTNRFSVVIPMPDRVYQPMTDAQRERNVQGWQKYNDDGTIRRVKTFSKNGAVEFARGLDIMCSQTELPGLTINVSETKYNGDTQKHGYSTTFGNHQFVFKLSKDQSEKIAIDEWMAMIVNRDSHEITYQEDYVVNIVINQLDLLDNIMQSVLLIDAFPVMSNPLTLSNADANATHELMVQFAYKKWVNVTPNPDAINTPDYSPAPYTPYKTGVSSLMQTPLGPYLAPFLSNPAIQKALEVMKNETGIDLEGEAVNIYNQIDTVVQETTGESINKSVSILNAIQASLELNDNITPIQITQLFDLIGNVVGKLKE